MEIAKPQTHGALFQMRSENFVGTCARSVWDSSKFGTEAPIQVSKRKSGLASLSIAVKSNAKVHSVADTPHLSEYPSIDYRKSCS